MAVNWIYFSLQLAEVSPAVQSVVDCALPPRCLLSQLFWRFPQIRCMRLEAHLDLILQPVHQVVFPSARIGDACR